MLVLPLNPGIRIPKVHHSAMRRSYTLGRVIGIEKNRKIEPRKISQDTLCNVMAESMGIDLSEKLS